MGKLRDILAYFIKLKPINKNITNICTHQSVPHTRYLNKHITLTNQQCKTCRVKICFACSETHIKSHCDVKIQTKNNISNDKQLKQLNEGYLMRLPLENLKCTCGTQLKMNNHNHAICAACGMASCSKQCHKQWENMGNCTYHLNFYEKQQNMDVRSILFPNIRNIHQSNIQNWSLAQRTGLNYLACYAKSGQNFVYLQRGYRNYGTPQSGILQKLVKINFGLDFTTHVERVCTCSCSACLSRQLHSVGNCQFDCNKQKDFNSFQYLENTTYYKECSCQCKFCSSGRVVTRHSKVDCFQHCYKSHYNVSKLF